MTLQSVASLAAPAAAPVAAAAPAPAPAQRRLEPVSGALTFARFAAPPNALGLCGGSDHDGLVGHLRAGLDGPDLVRLCQEFEGAWPYLELIAASAGIRDPLDSRVVDAYWLGGSALDRVAPGAFRENLESRFRPRTARREWPWLAGKPESGARPHHSFHVLEVMPRIGMLRVGQVAAILPAMERCLIRPATVVRQAGDGLVVATRPLIMADGRLAFGPTIEETVAAGGEDLSPGDDVAIHWGWSCGRLTPAQRRGLETVTADALRRANRTI
jgi:uncharacterized protein DUF6390